MKSVSIALIVLLCLAFAACQKNDVPKIPQISLIALIPQSGSMRVNVDTAAIIFGLTDGDGDIGNDPVSGIYLKDSRYESAGFVKTEFPAIDGSIEDPKKGLQGTCTFFPVPQPTPRLDSLHMALGDTMTYELYITDRAGHESNHITMPRLIIRP